MSNKMNKWTGEVWEVLSRLPGKPEAVADQRCMWDDLQASDTLRVVIFGAYDAGKSALLKRLLVEAGTAVPEWLTSSGRRETFEVREARSEGIVFLDTPGLGSGNSEHDRISLDAIKLADAYLWVLPPQLVTTGKQVFLEILSGRYFSNSLPSSAVAGSIVAAVARMDEAGIDPADNLDGFRALSQKKTTELELILSGGGVKASLYAIWCVAADPYQIVGNTLTPERDLYDSGRDWDGIEGLIGCLKSLRVERKRLRETAGARFVSILAQESQEQLRDIITNFRLTLEGYVNEIEHHRLYEQRLNALRIHAVAELHRSVEDELLSTSRSTSESVSDTARNLEDSLGRVVNEWSENSFSDYRSLANDLEFEIQNRKTSHDLAGFLRIADEADEEKPKHQKSGTTSSKFGKKILGFGPALRKGFNSYASSELDMSLKTAAERLEKIESSGETVNAFIKSRGRKATFRGTAHADKASRMVKWGRMLDAVGPLVEQLGGILLEVAEENMSARHAEERVKRHSELREKIRREAQKVENIVVKNFESTCDGLQSWLHERILNFEEKILELEQQIKTFRSVDEALNNKLQKYPT